MDDTDGERPLSAGVRREVNRHILDTGTLHALGSGAVTDGDGGTSRSGGCPGVFFRSTDLDGRTRGVERNGLCGRRNREAEIILNDGHGLGLGATSDCRRPSKGRLSIRILSESHRELPGARDGGRRNGDSGAASHSPGLRLVIDQDVDLHGSLVVRNVELGRTDKDTVVEKDDTLRVEVLVLHIDGRHAGSVDGLELGADIVARHVIVVIDGTDEVERVRLAVRDALRRLHRNGDGVAAAVLLGRIQGMVHILDVELEREHGTREIIGQRDCEDGMVAQGIHLRRFEREFHLHLLQHTDSNRTVQDGMVLTRDAVVRLDLQNGLQIHVRVRIVQFEIVEIVTVNITVVLIQSNGRSSLQGSTTFLDRERNIGVIYIGKIVVIRIGADVRDILKVESSRLHATLDEVLFHIFDEQTGRTVGDVGQGLGFEGLRNVSAAVAVHRLFRRTGALVTHPVNLHFILEVTVKREIAFIVHQVQTIVAKGVGRTAETGFHEDTGRMGIRCGTLEDETRTGERSRNLFRSRDCLGFHRPFIERGNRIVVEHVTVIDLTSVDHPAGGRIKRVILVIIHIGTRSHRSDGAIGRSPDDCPGNVIQVCRFAGQFHFGKIAHQDDFLEQMGGLFTRNEVAIVIRLHDTVGAHLGEDAVGHDDAGPVGARFALGPHRRHDAFLGLFHEGNCLRAVGDDVHMSFTFIHGKENLEIEGPVIHVGIRTGSLIRSRRNRLGQGVCLGIAGVAEHSNIHVLDAGFIGPIADILIVGAGAQLKLDGNLHLHRDRHETGLRDLSGLGGFEIYLLAAGDQAQQER